MARELLQNFESMKDLRLLRNVMMLLHLLVPLFVHGIAVELSVPLFEDVITKALCPGKSACSEALYLHSLHQSVSSLLMIAVLPLLCELSDEYGRKPVLLLTISTSIFPAAVLAIHKSRGFVYAYFVIRSLSNILSLRSIFCISLAYAADIVEEDKRVAAFSWITGVMSASHVMGSVLAGFFHGNYIFELSIVLLIFCPVYIQLFVTETLRQAPMAKASPLSILFKPIRERYQSIRYAVNTVITRPALRSVYLISFFYEFGMAGISSVLLLYLKAAYDLNQSKFSDVLIVVQIGSIFSQMVIVPVVNAFAGEKALLSMGLLASVSYATFYSMAWASWLPFISLSLGLAYGFVKPSICAMISRASNSTDQGKAQGFIAAVDSIAAFISPLIMTPLTLWFLSENAPFNCKGFGIFCGALSMMVALFCAMQLKPEMAWNHDLKVVLLT